MFYVIEFIDLLIFLLCVLVAVGGVTQILIPVMRGTRLFPMFISNHKKLEQTLVAVKEEVEESQLEKLIESERSKLPKKSAENSDGN